MSNKEYILNKQSQEFGRKIDFEKELNDSQLEVVTKGDGPCLVLAGAGSGKTRTLVYRVAYLLEKGIPEDQIMLVTFTNKAAKEMLSRVQELLGHKPYRLWGGTFHSIANRLLREHADVIGYKKNFDIIDTDDVKKMLTQIMKDNGVPKEKYIPKTRVIQSIISFAKNSQLSIQEVVQDKYNYLLPEVIPLLEKIAQAYEKKKQDAQVMDFDDLLLNFLKLLHSQTQQARDICNQFQYVLVDEFQDTNTIQAQIVHALARPQLNVLVVGDDAQSIYSFRAANVENILSFQQEYPGAKIYKLETNYRSTPDILQLANASIRNNKFQYEKHLNTPHESFQKPVLVPTRDQFQEADVICQRILELRDNDGLSLKDIAVLFRSSFHIIQLELELNKRGIPYIVRGGLRFFEQAHIKDVLSYLQIIHNAQNEFAWRRILGMFQGIGPATVSKIWRLIKDQDHLPAMLSILGDMPSRGKVQASIACLQRLFIELINMDQKHINEIITRILEQQYQAHLEQSYDDAKDRLEDLYQLAVFAGNYQDLASFLSEASLSEGFKGERAVARQDDTPEEALILSTIHQAKGLEWEAVFAMALAEGSFPHYKTMEKQDEIEEERRLFYVTVTRAKKHLYLLYPVMTRSAAMGDKINRPSMFIREIDSDLYDTWQVTESHMGSMVKFKNETPDMLAYLEDEEPDDSGGSSIFDMISGI